MQIKVRRQLHGSRADATPSPRRTTVEPHSPPCPPQLMMIGDQAVGKTALLVRFADDDFNESVLPTIGSERPPCHHASRQAAGRACSSRSDSAASPRSRSRLQDQDDRARRQANQAADLGHGGAGAISHHHAGATVAAAPLPTAGRLAHLAHARRAPPRPTKPRGRRPPPTLRSPSAHDAPLSLARSALAPPLAPPGVASALEERGGGGGERQQDERREAAGEERRAREAAG